METYLYDSKKRLALVHATRVDSYGGPSVINDSMFVYYNGDDSLVSKIITRTNGINGSHRQTIFVLGYNASRQVIYDTLYDYGNGYSTSPISKDYNTYTYLPGGVINSVSGSIHTGTPITVNHTYTTTYDNNKNLIQQNLDNQYLIKFGYTNVLSPYYKMLKLNYGFLPQLLPFGLSGPAFGATRYANKLSSNDTTVTLYTPPYSTIRESQYTTRSDNYPLTYHGLPDVTFAPPITFYANYGTFIYYK